MKCFGDERLVLGSLVIGFFSCFFVEVFRVLGNKVNNFNIVEEDRYFIFYFLK